VMFNRITMSVLNFGDDGEPCRTSFEFWIHKSGRVFQIFNVICDIVPHIVCLAL
jgi:hypothetical protein